jgi:hypothetical protein
VPISSRHEKLMLSGLVHQIISDAAETAPTETTTAFRAYLNRPGCRCTHNNTCNPSDSQPIPTKLGSNPVSVVTVCSWQQNTSNNLHQVPLPDFKDTATQGVTTNQHPNARCSPLKEKTSPRHKLKYKLALSDCNDSE